MKLFELILISLSLAMDAFSVSICKGLSIKTNFKKKAFLLALSFSIFQVLMPILGFLLGNSLSEYFLKFNHLIAFFLLTVIGFNMLKESSKENDINNSFSFKEILGLSIATSIDAFSIGITFSLIKVNLTLALIFIFLITFFLSFMGVILGKLISNKFQKLSEIFGGIVLILMGLKFLLEHFHIF